MSTARKQSKAEVGAAETYDNYKLGCLQRIADACETMALNYGRLIVERDSYKQRLESSMKRETLKDRQLSARKGQITKLKKCIAELEGVAK